MRIGRHVETCTHKTHFAWVEALAKHACITFGLLINVIFALYPAWRATRLKPCMHVRKIFSAVHRVLQHALWRKSSTVYKVLKANVHLLIYPKPKDRACMFLSILDTQAFLIFPIVFSSLPATNHSSS